LKLISAEEEEKTEKWTKIIKKFKFDFMLFCGFFKTVNTEAIR
jgi:hypothetical protein